jgi:hypothetical protein
MYNSLKVTIKAETRASSAVIVKSGRSSGRYVCVASAANAAQLHHIRVLKIVSFAATNNFGTLHLFTRTKTYSLVSGGASISMTCILDT